MVQQREKEPIKGAAAFISPVLTASSLYSNRHDHLCHDVWYPFKIWANWFPKLFCYRELLCCCNKYYDRNKGKANRQAKPTQGGNGSFHLLSCSSWLEAETIEEYHILTCSLISAWLVSATDWVPLPIVGRALLHHLATKKIPPPRQAHHPIWWKQSPKQTASGHSGLCQIDG